MTSRAFVELKERLKEVRTLASVDPTRAGETAQPGLSNAVNRGSLVLLSAHLEGFLEDVMTEALDALVTNRADVDRLPLLLRSVHAEEHLRDLEPMRDRNARAPRIERLFAEELNLWTSGNTLEATMIRHKTVCSEMDNPGSRQIRQFLDILSVDIREHLENEGKSALLQQVDGLVARRNSIAHGGASSATYVDVDAYMVAVEDIAYQIDSAIAVSIQDLCVLPTRPW